MPSKIKNLEKAATRIINAIKNRESIILYGDADLDGLTSVILMRESIVNLGGCVKAIYFPDRQKEGYGLNKTALKYLKKYSPAILILLDCGISNFDEIEIAKRMGFVVLIIDHHEVLNKLPKAEIIVDPKQAKDPYPFKGLAASGVVYLLTKELFKRKYSLRIRESFLELVAIATLADMMPIKYDNRQIVNRGLSVLMKTDRPGLKLFVREFRSICHDSPIEISQKAISVLNFCKIEDHLMETYRLLTASSEEEARPILEKLIEGSKKRHAQMKEMFELAKTIVESQPDSPISFIGNDNWPTMLLGHVASKICREYNKPTFVYQEGEPLSRGAVRTPKGISGVEAMKGCSNLLISYGGHHLASGFCVKTTKIKQLEICLVDYFSSLGGKTNMPITKPVSRKKGE
ncbi:MAG: DHH family phosphoesterase [bacterium]